MMTTIDLGIDGIEVVAPLGDGGQAVVYWARDLDHQREVAVKVFKLDADRGLFDRERKATGLLSSHDHVVQLHRSGETPEGSLYLVMEYADGGTLSDGRFSWDEGVGYLIEITTAVSAAHAQGVIHRDIKPQNVLLFSISSGSGHRAKIADFGIAAVPGTTTTTSLRGTTAYAPPELLLLGQKTDERGDIYSLGATTYFVLTGEHPPNVGAAKRAMELADQSPNLKPVWAVVAMAMADEPDDRYQRADDFATALGAARIDARALEASAQVSTKPVSGSVMPKAPQAGAGVVPDPGAGSQRRSLVGVPLRLDSGRNIAGLAAAVAASGLVLVGVFPAAQAAVVIVISYLIGVLVSHAIGLD